MDLFDYSEQKVSAPLAERMRARNLSEFTLLKKTVFLTEPLNSTGSEVVFSGDRPAAAKPRLQTLSQTEPTADSKS